MSAITAAAGPGPLVFAALRQAGAGAWAAARALLEQALGNSADRPYARYLLWETCQAMADPAAGVAHLRALVAENPITTRPARAPKRRVLALARVGDFQANLPLDALLDAEGTDLATLWIDAEAPHPAVTDPALLRRMAPGFDLAWIAIAEDARAAPALALAARLGVPVVNSGARIGAMTRQGVAALLADVPDAVVPPVALLPRAALAAGAMPFPLPVILRPEHSHAGAGLVRLDRAEDAAAALAANPGAAAFCVAPYVDFAGADGRFGKARVIFVAGQPYPFHYALHEDWRVWYYNAGMDRCPSKRAREAAFLADLPGFLGAPAMAALAEIGRRVGLDYFGLDCALMPDGRLLVFEVETGMIVHDRDDAALYPAKKQHVPRIFRAVEAMLDAKLTASPPRS